MNRIFTLDYLRGLSALFILIYHYLSWEGYEFDAHTFIRRIGFYGVTIFYILSGVTLYFVYEKKFSFNKAKLKEFFIKRVSRIYPLLILVTLLAVIISRKVPEFSTLFLNISGLFGYVKWDGAIATGAWSIGNELVFYSFFPFLIILAQKKNKLLFWGAGVIILSIATYFSIYTLPESVNNQATIWKNYINPLNQLIYFYAGIAIGVISKNINISSNYFWIIMAVCALALFTFFPSGNLDWELIYGTSRLILSIACFVIVFALYNIKITGTGVAHKPLLFLGEISYGVYLFHPIVYGVVKFILKTGSFSLNTITLIILCLAISIIVSYLSYEYFEKKLVKMGSRLLHK